MIDEWFGLLPNLEILSHDRFRPSTLLRIGGQRWTALDLEVCCSKEEFENLSGGSTLKKLRCRDFEVFGGHDRIVFPSSVVTVDLKPENWAVLNVENSNFASLHPPPNSQLRNLRIRLSPTKIAHLVDFPCLEYLAIRNIYWSNHELSWLAELTHLRRLRLDFLAGPEVETSLQELLFNLPRSIHRVDFSSDVPFGVLASLLPPGTDVSISQLGLPEYVTNYPHGGELDHLRDLCAGRGIDIIYFGKRDPIFGTSSLRSMISVAFSTTNFVSLHADF
jgi:hypothetical protein